MGVQEREARVEVAVYEVDVEVDVVVLQYKTNLATCGFNSSRH